MVARGIVETPKMFEGRIWLKSIWHVLRDIAFQIENEITIGTATLITLPDGEEKLKHLSALRKMMYPDEVSPFEALIKKYEKLMPHASGEQMTIRKINEDDDRAQSTRDMMKAPRGR